MIVLSDNDVRGAVAALRRILESSDWNDLARELDVQFVELEQVNLVDSSTDLEVWNRCQTENMVLITSNRSENDGETSLGQVIKTFGNPTSLPVVTIGDPNRVVKERAYADACAYQLLDFLSRIDDLRGAERLYLSPP